MQYEIYKKKLSKDEYFNSWESEKLIALTEKIKDYIYNKHLLKYEVMNRDNFTCQNKDCTYCNNIFEANNLTLHHIKFQKNGGKDIPRNSVIICRGSHQAFNRGKNSLQFGNTDNLPSHIRNHTFKLSTTEVINWKKVKSDMKNFRKKLDRSYRIKLSWEQIAILMQWLHYEYDGDDD